MEKLNMLFLGGSKRVSLAERFFQTASKMDLQLSLFSCEGNTDFKPLSSYAKILKGPVFKSDLFDPWLEKTLLDYDIDIVIPLMDSATVALSQFSKERKASRDVTKPWLCVSDYDLCVTMEDKLLAQEFFKKQNIPTPSNNTSLKIAKPRFGFRSVGISVLKNEKEIELFCNTHDCVSEYLIQDFVVGKETTVDFYVSPRKGLIGYVLRDRLEVSDGEVMVCTTRMPNLREQKVIEGIAAVSGWTGCITLQYLQDKDNNLFVIEINPRFGGGATCAIEAGLDMPRYILSEYLGLDFEKPKYLRSIKMTRARRDFFCELK